MGKYQNTYRKKPLWKKLMRALKLTTILGTPTLAYFYHTHEPTRALTDETAVKIYDTGRDLHMIGRALHKGYQVTKADPDYQQAMDNIIRRFTPAFAQQQLEQATAHAPMSTPPALRAAGTAYPTNAPFPPEIAQIILKTTPRATPPHPAETAVTPADAPPIRAIPVATATITAPESDATATSAAATATTELQGIYRKALVRPDTKTLPPAPQGAVTRHALPESAKMTPDTTVPDNTDRPTALKYNVRANDTLYRISRTFNLSVQELQSHNKGINPRALNIGQEVAIPHTPDRAKILKKINSTSPTVAPASRATAPIKESRPNRSFQKAAQPTLPANASNAQIWKALEQHMILREGKRPDVYKDSRGFPTVGIGHLVVPADNLKLGDVISEERIQQLFKKDLSAAMAAAKQQAREANISCPNFLVALCSVNFQLGTGWRGKFRNTWTHIKNGCYESAVQNLRASAWKQQTPTRVNDFEKALLTLSDTEKLRTLKTPKFASNTTPSPQ